MLPHRRLRQHTFRSSPHTRTRLPKPGNILTISGDYKGAFYREVNWALWKSIGGKIDLPSSEL